MTQPRGDQRSGDTDFWLLYEDALPSVYGFLVRRSDRSVAEDLTQEVFSTAVRTIAAGDRAKVTVPWLLTVARSRLYDHLRVQQRRERDLRLVSSRPADRDAVVTVEDSYDERNLEPATELALAALSPSQRAALVLHHLDDLSVADVADRMGRSVRATESLLARARRAFRSTFEEAIDG